MSNLTDEQQLIVDHISNNDGLTMVSAIAGSGKTTLLTSIAETLNPSNGIYMAYNKSVAVESQGKFPDSITCLTTHSLAYRAVKEAGYKLDLEANITYRILPGHIPYEIRCSIIDAINHFCLSEYLDFTEFCKAHTDLLPSQVELGESTINSMTEGKCKSSHSFYLKLYHLLLAHGDIEYDDFDLIMLDEAGDLNLVTLEIFKLLPSPKKVMVGDASQNIYGFNRTVNCFQLMHAEGTIFSMTQSFRVSNHIANGIEKFCKSYMDSSMSFKGVEVDQSTITSEAFIARTNSSLITKMIELNRIAVPYNLTRSPDTLFQIPKMLCFLKPKSYVSVPGYAYLQKDIDDYSTDPQLQRLYKSSLLYIGEMHKEDVALQSALKLIFAHGVPVILDCYNTAKKHATSRKKHKLTLGTSHSMKGLEFDSVTLANDMDTSISDIIDQFRSKTLTIDDLTEEQRSSLNLYYVAASRSRKELKNATYITQV